MYLGDRTAATPEALQEIYRELGSTEMYVRIATKRHVTDVDETDGEPDENANVHTFDQANIYADVIAWGKANGMAGIRYWAPDYEGWFAMSMFEFSNQVGTAKTILLNHKDLIER